MRRPTAGNLRPATHGDRVGAVKSPQANPSPRADRSVSSLVQPESTEYIASLTVLSGVVLQGSAIMMKTTQ